MSLIGWLYFFAAPGVTSLLIAACLVAALFTLRRADQTSVATRMESKAS
jgi:precorrin-4 methylase